MIKQTTLQPSFPAIFTLQLHYELSLSFPHFASSTTTISFSLVILIPICILRVLQIYLDLIVHLMVDILAASTRDDPNNTKRQRRIRHVLDSLLICPLYRTTSRSNDRSGVVFREGGRVYSAEEPGDLPSGETGCFDGGRHVP
jgi:hypothetical protein